MKEDVATEYGKLIYSSTKQLAEMVPRIKQSCSEEEYTPHIEKIAHILALGFDILDLLGNEYSNLNPHKQDDE